MLYVHSEIGCNTCLGKINDVPCSYCSLQSPVSWPYPRELNRNPSHQVWFAYLIALLEELQIRESWKSLSALTGEVSLNEHESRCTVA